MMNSWWDLEHLREKMQANNTKNNYLLTMKATLMMNLWWDLEHMRERNTGKQNQK